MNQFATASFHTKKCDQAEGDEHALCDQENATILLLGKQFQPDLDIRGVHGEGAAGEIAGAGTAAGGFATGKGTLIGGFAGGTDVGGV